MPLNYCLIFNMIPALLILLVTFLFLIYKYWTRNFDYWKKRNVPYLEPSLVTGNFKDVLTMRLSMGHHIENLYNRFSTPYFGVFVLNQPFLVIRSPEIIKSILVKDFNSFADRTAIADEKCDSIASKMLFAIKSPEWKTLRAKTTPIFTTGKIKTMLALIQEVANKMTKHIDETCSSGPIEIKETCAKYGIDVIASCAFGINANCFENENCEFRVMGKKIFEFTLKNSVRQTSYFLAHALVRLFKISFFAKSFSTFMREMLWNTINEREKGQYKRNDLIDIIIQMKNDKSLVEEVKFEGDTVIAQAVQFIAAGFETTSSTISFTLYEFSRNPEIQAKAREEAKEVFERYGSFTYDALQEMKYLHMVICEILRMYPVLPFLDRRCNADYKLPGTDLTLDKGTPIFISMLGLHYDPEYHSEPHKFDPERFSDENKHNIPSFTYFPFGEGPRNCIGERFGLMVVKLALATLLVRYEIEKIDKTPIPIEFYARSITLIPSTGIPLQFKRISKQNKTCS